MATEVEQVRAAAEAFAKAIEAVGGRQYAAELDELRKREVAALVVALDGVREALVVVLEPLDGPASQFAGDFAGQLVEEIAGRIGMAGDQVHELVEALDPETAKALL